MTHDTSPLGVAGRIALCGLFASVPRLFVDVEAHGMERDPGAPRTFYAMMHKRDIDGMAPLPTLLRHRGWRGLRSDVRFAMRSDAFEPGFLARMAPRPRALSLLLRPISVGPLLRGVGVYPLNELKQRPAEVWLREALRVEGDQAVGKLLTPEYLAELAATAGRKSDGLPQMRLSHLLGWRFHAALQAYYGPDIFTASARRRAERRVLEAAKASLDGIAAWLRGGGSIFNGPEGRLSPDGHLSPITSGMYRVLRASPTDTSVGPIALVYDFMTTGRMRLFVDFAPPLENAPLRSRHDLFAALRRAWLEAARFTCSQLASGMLIERGKSTVPVVRSDELADAVCAQAHTLDAMGRHVDRRLLDLGSAARLARHYLAFVERRGIVRRERGDRWRVVLPVQPLVVPRGGVGYDVSPLLYAANELADMLAGA